MLDLPFSIGILSWKGYDSLLNSLITYEDNGLSKLTKYKYICLPEYKKEGIEIAKKFGYKPILIKENIGILGGFKVLAKTHDGPGPGPKKNPKLSRVSKSKTNFRKSWATIS